MHKNQKFTNVQIKDNTLTSDNVDISTPGKALITKIIVDTGLQILNSTGVDEGTGEVTLKGLQVNQFRFDPPTTNMTGSGIVISLNISSNSIGIGACLAIDQTSYIVVEASALDENLIPAIGIALKMGTGQKDVLIQGTFRNDSWSWIPYATLYVSTNTGLITQTRPNGIGENIQEIGFALSSNVILFNPDKTYFTL